MGSLLPNPSNVPVSVSGDWEPLVNINAAGNQAFNMISLTNWDGGTLAPAIAAGSMIQTGGSIANFPVNEPIGGVATGVNYLKFTVSGSTVTPVWTMTAPVWDAAKGGWYSGSDRYSGHVCYQTGGAYSEKHILANNNGITTKIVNFVHNNTQPRDIPHHVANGYSKIVNIEVNHQVPSISRSYNIDYLGYVFYWNDTNVNIMGNWDSGWPGWFVIGYRL